jgi:hypothetical protein
MYSIQFVFFIMFLFQFFTYKFYNFCTVTKNLDLIIKIT